MPTQMAALMGANIIKVKPPTAVISLEAAKKSYEKIDGSTLAKRVEHVMQCAFNGRRVVVFSGGEAKDLDGVYEEVRGLRDGGANGSIIGRNTFQRPKEVALEMLNKIIDIYSARPEHGGNGRQPRRLPRLPDHAAALDPVPFADRLAAALDAGDVAAVQLRLKDVDDDAWRRAIDALRPVTQSRDVAFLLNDRADLVRATGSDGAHVGQEDMPARQARALMGPDATLGVTCKGSRDLAMAGRRGRRRLRRVRRVLSLRRPRR